MCPTESNEASAVLPGAAIASVCILGATGSIGLSTLDVIERHPERYRVFAFSAYGSHVEMLELCRKFNPKFAVMVDSDAATALEEGCKKLGLEVQVRSGALALDDIAAQIITIKYNERNPDSCLYVRFYDVKRFHFCPFHPIVHPPKSHLGKYCLR